MTKKLLTQLLLFLLLIPFLNAKEEINQEKANTSAQYTQNIENIQKFNNQIKFIELSKTIEDTIKEEKKNLFNLNQELIAANKNVETAEQSINSYKIQISSYTNLLALETTQIKELERIYMTTLSVLDQIDERIVKLNKRMESLKQLSLETFERHKTNKKQLSEISIEKVNDLLTVPEILVGNLETLTLILEDKINIFDKILNIFKEQSKHFLVLKESFTSFKEKCKKNIDERRTKALFQRKTSFKEFVKTKTISTEFTLLLSKCKMFFSKHFWINFFKETWNTYGIYIFTSMIVLIIITIFSFKLKKLLLKATNKLTDSDDYFWCNFSLYIFSRSIVILCICFFFMIFKQLFHEPIFIVEFTIMIFILWLFTRWIQDAILLFEKKFNGKVKIPDIVIKNSYLFIILIRSSFILYLIIFYGLEDSEQLLTIMRIFFEVCLLAIVALFWKLFFKTNESHFAENHFQLIIIRLLAICINFVVSVCLIMELSGFAQLSVYWQISWSRTIIVCLWSMLIFLVINEINIFHKTKQSDDVQQNTQKTLKWVFIRISYLIWAFLTIISVLFAWGLGANKIIGLIKILNHPIPIGGMTICLPGFVYCFLILIFTHMLVKIWRNTILKKLLENSGMASGIQDTISTITSYSFWVFGIILALNAIGISTTSLTVAFGAFGIGLGFGLQNIFNNFISGLIILFERPIQVGDWVEINTIWGIVKKINVRSTVVQSADNASLIIPNSEFISNRLINWSFKDLKIRRNIKVSVAYGSDVKKVSQILLDIANKNLNVYSKPEPDVVFLDFGDNALIFQLRVWVHIDYSISTQSKIRYEIERLFKENNIIIPFPQRDIHIYNNDLTSDKKGAYPMDGGQ